MNEKFPKRERIKKKKEIEEILKNGTRGNEKSFIYYFMENRLNYSRFAIIISKKIGKSHYRNRIKRIFREIYRHNKKNLKKSIDLLIRPKLGIKDKYWELNSEFLDMLNKVNA